MLFSTHFTSESVCAGHPDKMADQISDAILDEVLRRDPKGRVAIDTLITTNQVVLAGEITTKAKVDYEQVARQQLQRLGYTDSKLGLTHQSPVSTYIHQQSSEIATGVDKDGAGDQGMMFGFANKDTVELMPLPITLAHRLAERIDELRMGELSYLMPNGKTQATVRYENGKPVTVETVVLAVPHDKQVSLRQVKKDLFDKAVLPILDAYKFKLSSENLTVNGTGAWHTGGIVGDTGMTGRKIIVDGYGGFARVGGGCFSGKDATKVDRSGAYAARYLAKNLVAQGVAEQLEIGLAYCIGQPQPVMKTINTFGTEIISIKEIKTLVDKLLDTSVRGIIEKFNLCRPIYLPTATYGHFGRSSFPWEELV